MRKFFSFLFVASAACSAPALEIAVSPGDAVDTVVLMVPSSPDLAWAPVAAVVPPPASTDAGAPDGSSPSLDCGGYAQPCCADEAGTFCKQAALRCQPAITPWCPPGTVCCL